MAGKVGLGVAVDYALKLGLDAIFERLQHLASTLRTTLTAIEGVSVHDTGQTRCGITTFSVEGIDAADIERHLRERDVNVSVSSPPSTLLDATERNLPTLVRASVHYYNTTREIKQFANHLSTIPHPA